MKATIIISLGMLMMLGAYQYMIASGILFDGPSYCEDLVVRAEDETINRYLKGWAKTIRAKGELTSKQVVQSIGIMPGSAKIYANVSWGLFGWGQNGNEEMRVVVDELGNYKVSNIKFLFFAEISRFGYLVKVSESASFDQWRRSDIQIIDDDIAVYCSTKK